MKKISIIALSLLLCTSLAACGKRSKTPSTTAATETTTETSMIPGLDPTIMDPTIHTNIPDPEVDTSMPDIIDPTLPGHTNDNDSTATAGEIRR